MFMFKKLADVFNCVNKKPGAPAVLCPLRRVRKKHGDGLPDNVAHRTTKHVDAVIY